MSPDDEGWVKAEDATVDGSGTWTWSLGESLVLSDGDILAFRERRDGDEKPTLWWRVERRPE